MQDTCKIHARYMYLKCIERDVSDMQETCEIHILGDMYWGNHDTYGIHQRFMRDTCGDTCRIHLSSEAITIHTGYIRDSCEIHAKYMRDTYLGCQGGNVSMSSWCAAHLSGHPRPPCVQMGLLQPPRAAPSSALSLVFNVKRRTVLKWKSWTTECEPNEIF